MLFISHGKHEHTDKRDEQPQSSVINTPTYEAVAGVYYVMFFFFCTSSETASYFVPNDALLYLMQRTSKVF